MWRWCSYLSGVLLIAVALVALPSAMIVESYVGGSAIHGSVEDGRYFVNPGHGQPITEVSESTWRAVYWLERLWPWSALIPGWIGTFLMWCGRGLNWKPPLFAHKELPPWMIRACFASGGFTVVGTWLFWLLLRTPWATMLVGSVLFYTSTGTLLWIYTRSLRQQATTETGAAPDPAA